MRTFTWTRLFLKKKENWTIDLLLCFILSLFHNLKPELGGCKVQSSQQNSIHLTFYYEQCREEKSFQDAWENKLWSCTRTAKDTRFPNTLTFTSRQSDNLFSSGGLWKQLQPYQDLVGPQKLSRRSLCQVLREVTNSPRLSSNDLLKSLKASGVNVHRSTVRRALNKEGFSG
jgi:hypothetical protein